MKLAALFGSSSGAIGTAAVGAVVVVAGAVGFNAFNAPDPAPQEPAVVAAAPEGPPPEAVIPETEPVAEVEPDVVPDVSPDVGPIIEPPRLDLVRVAPDGNTVIAGQTSPDMPVAILLDGIVIAEARADGAGDFVTILTLAPSDAPRALSVEARPEGGDSVAGVETVLIAPFTAVPEAVAAVEPEALPVTTPAPTPEAIPEPNPLPDPTPLAVDIPVPEPTPEPERTTPDPQPAPVVAEATALPVPAPTPTVPTSSAPGTLAAPVVSPAPAVIASETRPAAVQPARAVAPAVVIASPEGLRVVQGPIGEPAVQTSVRLDAISYNAQGAVILAGRGPVSADIQVYLNNQPIQLGEIGAGGDWSLQLPDVDPGTYTLAVAELAEDGSTASRVETPFLREDPERVAEAPEARAAGIDVITVQPGFTLWGMARDTFGDGILYVQIFEENRDQIRDPNWIFPGQIFRMPEVDAQTSGN